MNLFKKSLVVLLPLCMVLAGCTTTDDGNTTSEDAASTSEIDYVNDGSVALTLDYAGHDFYKDGIGQVTLKTPIDGDTAHFTPLITTTSSELIKSRFWGIDTPESTGQIQEYGKAASNFTKSRLQEANENGTIVVASPYTSYKAPENDSTGTRYVSLIWINLTKKNAAYNELYLLNLEIVQVGYSWVKNVSDMPSYSDTFYNAETQARALKLNMFSGEPDPLFNYGDYENVSLLELKNEIVSKIKDNSHVNKYDGAKVTVCGTVAGYANHIIYIESYFDSSTGSSVDGGEYAGINIFTGMSSIPSKFTKLNTYIQVSGVAEDSDTFGFQITGANFPKAGSGAAGEAEVLITAADNIEEYSLYTFNYKTKDEIEGSYKTLAEGDLDALFCATTLHGDLYCYGGYDSSDGSEHTLYLKLDDANGKATFFVAYITFTYKPDESDPNYSFSSIEQFKGHTYTLSGIFGYHVTTSGKVSYQMVPRNSSDLVLVS